MSLTVRRVGAESASVVLAIIQDAFGSRPPLHPPADALSDTVDGIATRLALTGGLVARLDDVPVGTVLFDPLGNTVYLRRFGVVTSAQGHGIAPALIRAAVEATEARYDHLTVVAREELPKTIDFWRRRGFMQTDRRSPYVELSRPLPTLHQVPTADAMKDLGRRIAADLRPGDLVVLTGDLGAGKTTLTQGLGAGLGVEGAITSPTFVIAREHAAGKRESWPASEPRLSGLTGPGGPPGLVHVDAYRLGSAAELDDLDLDSALDTMVTVVEWGEGLAEDLAESRLEIRITREPVGAESELEPRLVEVVGLGPRWATAWPVAEPPRAAKRPRHGR